MPNIEYSIQNYIQGKAEPDDEKILLKWLEENPDNRYILFGEKDAWDASQIGSGTLNAVERHQWFELQKRISKQNSISPKLAEWLKIAAIVLVTFGAGWMGHYYYVGYVANASLHKLKRVEALNGQIKEIFLADGSHVWLNSGSSLLFPQNFTENNREVQLSGEAFFEVTANEEKPFLVKTGNHTVKVTGTRFNVCEYPESKIIETTLEEGKVKIHTGNIFKDLMPGQQSSFHTETARIKIGEADFEIYTSWKEGRYEFRNEPIAKIFQIIERWWDVKIEYPDDALKNERITGTLRKHKPLEQHFDVIKQLVAFHYEIESDLVTITLQ